MSVRLVVTFTAAPGKGGELAKAFEKRAAECRKEPGCEQFDIFQGTTNSDQVVLLERWSDQDALDTHAKLNRTRPPLDATLRLDTGAREDYEYNRTR
jgi:quinol monooxygenase YgiN